LKAVNLIPPDQRRATREDGSPTQLATRALLAVLAFGVVAVTALVLISNQVKDKEDELAEVSQKQVAAKAAGDALRPYGTFVQLQKDRYNTVTALARSRFNWERVMRQLSRTVPDDVWLTELTGTVSPASTTSGGSGGGALRGGVQGPAVELKGCARDQKAAARMIVRMRNLDNVDTVVLTRSEQPQQETTQAGGAPTAGGAAGGCEGNRYEIELLIAFKASPAASASAPAAPAQAQPAAGGTAPTTTSTTPATTTGGTP
jgi:Tfp pilus assembly protein PilN